MTDRIQVEPEVLNSLLQKLEAINSCKLDIVLVVIAQGGGKPELLSTLPPTEMFELLDFVNDNSAVALVEKHILPAGKLN